MNKWRPVKQNLYAVLEHAAWGDNAYLGLLLHEIYPSGTTLVLPSYFKVTSIEERAAGKEINRDGLFSESLISLFSYPVKVEFKNYNFNIDASTEQTLLNNAMRSESMNNFEYHFLRNDQLKNIVLYINNNKLIFVPTEKASRNES